jgi:ornithine decarboxylase
MAKRSGCDLGESKARRSDCGDYDDPIPDYVSLDEMKGRIGATLALIYPPGIGVVVPGERWDDRAQPMLDYFMAFQESFNRFPGFNYEVQGVYQERIDDRIKFYTYAVRR